MVVVDDLRSSVVDELQLGNADAREDSRDDLRKNFVLDNLEGLGLLDVGVLRVNEGRGNTVGKN